MGIFQLRIPATHQLLGTRGVGSLDTLPTQFNALVWNVAKGADPALPRHLEHLTSFSDLVMLQEAVESRTPTARHAWSFARSFEVQDSFTGVAIGSPTRPLAAVPIQSAAREPFTHTPKMMLASRFNIVGRSNPLLVLNVHAVNFVSNEAFRSQLAQLAEVIRDHPRGPILLAGDFNTWSPYRLSALRALAKDLKLTPATPTNDPRRLVLDHVLVRDLSVTSASVFGDVGSSDHKPLFLRLQATREP